jgi:hypothetical protein
MSLAEEEGFLPAYSNAPYTTSHQVSSGIDNRHRLLQVLYISKNEMSH